MTRSLTRWASSAREPLPGVVEVHETLAGPASGPAALVGAAAPETDHGPTLGNPRGRSLRPQGGPASVRPHRPDQHDHDAEAEHPAQGPAPGRPLAGRALGQLLADPVVRPRGRRRGRRRPSGVGVGAASWRGVRRPAGRSAAPARAGPPTRRRSCRPARPRCPRPAAAAAARMPDLLQLGPGVHRRLGVVADDEVPAVGEERRVGGHRQHRPDLHEAVRLVGDQPSRGGVQGAAEDALADDVQPAGRRVGQQRLRVAGALRIDELVRRRVEVGAGRRRPGSPRRRRGRRRCRRCRPPTPIRRRRAPAPRRPRGRRTPRRVTPTVSPVVGSTVKTRPLSPESLVVTSSPVAEGDQPAGLDDGGVLEAGDLVAAAAADPASARRPGRAPRSVPSR